MDFVLALGGGGAKGVAHIPVLEALDDLGLKPREIAGTSIGALIAAGYAGGMSGAELREHVVELSGRRARALWSLLRDPRSSWGLLSPEAAYDLVVPDCVPETFGELGIPVSIVATDFYAHESVYLEEGSLRTAVAASIAIPGVFAPVSSNDRTLVDGGLTQNLPVRALPRTRMIAVDVMDYPVPSGDIGRVGFAVGSMQIMIKAAMQDDLNARPPDLLLEPNTAGTGPLDFYRMPEILEQASTDTDEFKRLIAGLAELGAGGRLA